ncbi:MAG: hypothetical protein U0R19_21355 [Bryobacteraceae bacterium]
MKITRRKLAALAMQTAAVQAQEPGERPQKSADVQVLNPRNKVPVSLLIDDSTCLVNLAHFGIPHFAEAYPDRYLQEWRKLPREIPDSFVREFGEWTRDNGVKGKYSIVPYPACVGWVDRDMPGWSRKELTDSLSLVRTLIAPNWDIHPEMITHTWVIDTKTGRPFPERTERFMENFGWSQDKSADELANYMAYALRILKNAELPCEGITTPGGFAGRRLVELSKATLQACRDVYQTEIPHYFRHAILDSRSVVPRVENVRGLNGPNPQCVVSIIACTGDWYGGWDGLVTPALDKMITADSKSGRMAEVIERGEPAIMMCHWPGIYCNGQKDGFQTLKDVHKRLKAGYGDRIQWMKIGDIARYWAAKELTGIAREGNRVKLRAPYACPDFTIEISARGLRGVRAGSVKTDWKSEKDSAVVTFDLPKGETTLELV